MYLIDRQGSELWDEPERDLTIPFFNAFPYRIACTPCDDTNWVSINPCMWYLVWTIILTSLFLYCNSIERNSSDYSEYYELLMCAFVIVLISWQVCICELLFGPVPIASVRNLAPLFSMIQIIHIYNFCIDWYELHCDLSICMYLCGVLRTHSGGTRTCTIGILQLQSYQSNTSSYQSVYTWFGVFKSIECALFVWMVMNYWFDQLTSVYLCDVLWAGPNYIRTQPWSAFQQ